MSSDANWVEDSFNIPEHAALCTWCDDDGVGFFDYINGLVHVDLSVSANNLHWLATGCGGGAVPPQDDVGQGAVHSLHGEESCNQVNAVMWL